MIDPPHTHYCRNCLYFVYPCHSTCPFCGRRDSIAPRPRTGTTRQPLRSVLRSLLIIAAVHLAFYALVAAVMGRPL